MTIQTVEERFEGAELATYTDPLAVYTLYRTPEDLYLVHTDEGETAWLESGADGEGLTEGQVRMLWPELAEAAAL
jgi:hypothetical protein